MKRAYLAGVCLATATLMGQVALAEVASSASDRTPPCLNDEVDESIPRCVWDARHMGNGEGRSYVWRPRLDDIRYVTHRRAHRLMTTNR